jgi:RimJ/RimL family protein N-acetyltransferase
MAALGSTTPIFQQPYEGAFRATALVLEGEQRVAFVSVDAITLPGDIAARAAQRIAAASPLPATHLLATATHTHRGLCTIDFLGCTPNHEYLRRMEEGIVQAVLQAQEKLDRPGAGPNEVEAELLLGLSQEATVGRNSRILLRDGEIGWHGYAEEDMVRPTGPYDPDLQVLALRRPGGEYAGLIFNHSVHNIGHVNPEALSPCFYGLSALEIEQRHGATTLFMPGAFGSNHNKTFDSSGVAAEECVVRVVAAIEDGLQQAQPALKGPVRVLRRPFTYRLRSFDEATEAEAVRRYGDRYFAEASAGQQAVFAEMRQEMAPLQGHEQQCELMAVRLGEVGIIGIPGEMFGRLGVDLRRRSPFRHTIIIGLANDEIGYIPDRQAYADGGYQTWVGWHCRTEPGTGEAMVEFALEMLRELDDETMPPRQAPQCRRLQAGDAVALQSFYNTLPPASRQLFRPGGWNQCLAQSREYCAGQAGGSRYDLVLDTGRELVGWAFLMGCDQPRPTLGIGLTEAICGQGWGRQLVEELLAEARRQGKEAVELTVVQSNERARRLYERCGFVVTGTRRGGDEQEYLEMTRELA